MIKYLFIMILLVTFSDCISQATTNPKPTICILGGTPSSAKILDEIPADLKERYNFISFNRPGFGGTPNEVWDEKRLFEIALQVGLKENDFAVIGVSGGGPLAILLASHFRLQHCGIISGMVPAKEYFAYADFTFTKSLMHSAVGSYDDFKKTIKSFPNVEQILQQAESPLPAAIRACYDDLHFILTGIKFKKRVFRKLKPDWLHGENDENVALKSAQLFLSKFKNANLTVLYGKNHAIDARILVRQLIGSWEEMK
jgi:pimeloyl-ACP methyl ester carboxylesterase